MATSLQPEVLSNPHTITAHSPGRVQVGATVFTTSLLLSPRLGPQAWSIAQLSDISEDTLDALRAHGPELILLGTGRRIALLPPRLQARLLSCGTQGEPPIGLECMDTAAACRTYNLLAAEGRQVLAALIVE